MRQAIEATGAALVFLPPYSPDYNPIENAFAKLKALLRKAAERTVEGLWRTIGTILYAFTPHECQDVARFSWVPGHGYGGPGQFRAIPPPVLAFTA